MQGRVCPQMRMAWGDAWGRRAGPLPAAPGAAPLPENPDGTGLDPGPGMDANDWGG